MWAGGEMSFMSPLRAGDRITRVSRIADVTHKRGRSGELVFVAVEHDILSGDDLAVRERQDIVYRASENVAAVVPVAPSESPIPTHREEVAATTTLLFRYSALTFNGHRIHYDLDYACNEEGYGGLVVHGPLQATLLLHLAARVNGNRSPVRFAYRGVAPLFHGGRFSVNAVRSGDEIELWTAGDDRVTRMVAKASLAS
jgi:3-methylfumaryl-CoA hydratase